MARPAVEGSATLPGCIGGLMEVIVAPSHPGALPFVADPREATTDLVGELLAEFARPLPQDRRCEALSTTSSR